MFQFFILLYLLYKLFLSHFSYFFCVLQYSYICVLWIIFSFNSSYNLKTQWFLWKCIILFSWQSLWTLTFIQLKVNLFYGFKPFSFLYIYIITFILSSFAPIDPILSTTIPEIWTFGHPYLPILLGLCVLISILLFISKWKKEKTINFNEI